MRHVEAQASLTVAQSSSARRAATGTDRIRAGFSLGMVLASFLIYAAAALLVHREQRNDFIQERSSMAAAVSQVVYHARLGSVYSGVLAQLLQFTTPLDETLARMTPQAPPGTLQGATADGNGIGYIVVSTVSMRLFGLHTSSMVLAMLALMGLSALAFVSRFPDERAVVVILYFTSLTVMLFTPLVWNAFYAHNISVGGIRYFSLVAILPGFHLLLEGIDPRRLGPRLSTWPILAMAAQVVLLLLAVLVRNSAAMTIGAIAVACVVTAWSRRGERGAATRILGKAGWMTVVGALFVGVLMVSASRTYLDQGRFTETVWHRIFVSLGLSPQWPFGDLRSVYDCTAYIPEGLVNGPEDRNGHCILWVYAAKHHIPTDVVVTMVYGRGYDDALREAFFNILWRYPRETLSTFFLIKPRYVAWSIGESMNFTLVGAPPGLILLLIASLGSLLLFSLVPSPISRLSSHRLVAGVTLLFAACTIPPYIMVWAMPYTSGDLLLCCFIGMGLAVTAATAGVRGLLASPSPARARVPTN